MGNVAGGQNLIFGDGGSDFGDDIIEVNIPLVFTNQNNQHTINAGDGPDEVILSSNGNNIVFADASAQSADGGNDFVEIFGEGNNSVVAGRGNDEVFIDGGGSNTVFGNKGNDIIEGVNSRDVTFFGGNGDDDLIADDLTGAASIS